MTDAELHILEQWAHREQAAIAGSPMHTRGVLLQRHVAEVRSLRERLGEAERLLRAGVALVGYIGSTGAQDPGIIKRAGRFERIAVEFLAGSPGEPCTHPQLEPRSGRCLACGEPVGPTYDSGSPGEGRRG